jgi:hypothetical protein
MPNFISCNVPNLPLLKTISLSTGLIRGVCRMNMKFPDEKVTAYIKAELPNAALANIPGAGQYLGSLHFC